MPNETVCKQHLDAFRTAKIAKNVMFGLLLLVMLAQIAGFALVYFFDVIDYAPELQNRLSARAAPTSMPAVPPAANVEVRAGEIYLLLKWGLHVSRMLAFFCSILFCLVLLLYVNLSIVSRLGDMAGFISAFFWSLVLLAVLMPWYKLFPTELAQGALFNLEDLIEQTRNVKNSWTAGRAIPPEQLILYFTRFAAYPLFALIVLLVCQCRFMHGYKPIGQLVRGQSDEPTTQAGVSL
ncbi:MAG: hypothetical protein HZA50_07995 [Planctomycetes bacterium]|nr:hypothetical protein [Planctomycetota bacterium]